MENKFIDETEEFEHDPKIFQRLKQTNLPKMVIFRSPNKSNWLEKMFWKFNQKKDAP